MSQRKDNLISGLLLVSGMIVGAATAFLVQENRPKKASTVLAQVKEELTHLGTITGSWIDYDPIEYDLFESKPLVYYGGLSVEGPSGEVVYQFACDIYTGDIVDYFQLHSPSEDK